MEARKKNTQWLPFRRTINNDLTINLKLMKESIDQFQAYL